MLKNKSGMPGKIDSLEDTFPIDVLSDIVNSLIEAQSWTVAFFPAALWTLRITAIYFKECLLP